MGGFHKQQSKVSVCMYWVQKMTIGTQSLIAITSPTWKVDVDLGYITRLEGNA